jgi:hypothetical protein
MRAIHAAGDETTKSVARNGVSMGRNHARCPSRERDILAAQTAPSVQRIQYDETHEKENGRTKRRPD